MTSVNVDTCTLISPAGSEQVETAGCRNVFFPQGGGVDIECYSNDGRINASDDIEVFEGAGIISFDASPTTLPDVGGDVTFTWSTVGMDACGLFEGSTLLTIGQANDSVTLPITASKKLSGRVTS